ncbi:MAG: MBL fold metallo-hydrolase [Elainella sp.]
MTSSLGEFGVRFWGVRGGVPTPGIETLRYGGNTSCVEIQVAGKRLIFDGGTGLRVLGRQMLCEQPVQAHLFFTHTYWDRIQGFPFFKPAFVQGNRFNIYGATGQNGASIKQRLSDQMLRPHFPVPLQRMQADLRFHNIAPGTLLQLDEVEIETMALHRANNALGFRITWQDCSVVYATETEYSQDGPDQALLYLANRADLLIYDTVQQDCLEFDATAASRLVWQPAIEIATAAQVKQIVLSHHDPAHEDDFLDQVEAEAQSAFPQVQLAHEGMVLALLSQVPSPR